VLARTILAGALAVTAFAATAQADPRVDAYRMSCDAVADAVERNGASIVYYGPHLYRRVVANLGYCDHGQLTRPDYMPTADTDQCFVGYECVHRTPRGSGR